MWATFHIMRSCQHPPAVYGKFLRGLKAELKLHNVCAFLGNDYDFLFGRKRIRRSNSELIQKVQEHIVRLIENEGVDQFFVGEAGGFEKDAYKAVLNVKEKYPHIKIILVISRIPELHATGVDVSHIVQQRAYCDDFILPDKCAVGYKRLCVVYRNQYIITHADFIIAYNKYKGRAYKFCMQAKNKGVRVIELADRS